MANYTDIDEHGPPEDTWHEDDDDIVMPSYPQIPLSTFIKAMQQYEEEFPGMQLYIQVMEKEAPKDGKPIAFTPAEASQLATILSMKPVMNVYLSPLTRRSDTVKPKVKEISSGE